MSDQESESLPCIVCRKRMFRAFHGIELQPEGGLHFSAEGAYGTTVFDPMDLSSVDVVICDECITKAGEEGIVRLSQFRIPIVDDDDVVAGYYSPERESVVWNPSADYGHQQPVQATLEEIASAEPLSSVRSSTTWWRAGAVHDARERLSKEEAEG